MDYTTALEEVKEWAKSLIIMQYRQSPQNRALIDSLVNLIFANNILYQIRDLCLNLDNSTGAQLDITGQWLGLDRFYTPGFFTDKAFALVPYSEIKRNKYQEIQGGFSNYTNFNTLKGGFLTYATWAKTITEIYTMPDYLYQPLLKLKAIKNSLKMTMKNIDDAINEWSNGEVFTTWQNMQVTYNYQSNYSQIVRIAQIKDVLPAPIGCIIKLQEID